MLGLRPSSTRCGVAGALLLGASLSPAVVSKPEERPLLIPVAPLGFRSLSGHFVSTAATMFTLHFVDEQHVLFTFTVRSLLARLPDQAPGDDDRNVRVMLLELPTGKVLAETELRTRDRDRYLWPLEHGRFLLRVRSKLSVIEPLRSYEAAGPAEAFRQQAFVDLKRPIGYLSVSPGGDVLGVETLPPPKPKPAGVSADAAALAATIPGYKKDPELQVHGAPKVQIHFFRLREKSEEGKEGKEGRVRLVATSSGLVGAPNLITLPLTGEGFLDVKKESASAWLFDFVTHTGKRMELAGYETTCAPHPYFVSRSEFVALGCRGSSDRVELSYFNLKGEEPWLSVLSGTQVSPSVVAAPAAGRFALSRTLVAGAVFDAENLTVDSMTAQEITVMQNHDGRVLLKVLATPIQRVGQNFDFSPSGGKFAVLRGGNIEVYTLPALNGKDQKAVEMARGQIPEENDAPVRLNAVAVAVKREAEQEETAAEAPAGGGDAAAVGQAASAPVAPSAPVASRTTDGARGAETLPDGEAVQQTTAARAEGALGDAQEGGRKAPSLFSDGYPRGKDDPKAKKPE